jgi:hypothetical protein
VQGMLRINALLVVLAAIVIAAVMGGLPYGP